MSPTNVPTAIYIEEEVMVTPRPSGRPTKWALLILLSVFIVGTGLYLSGTQGTTKAATRELPPGVVNGAVLMVGSRHAGGSVVELFVVREVHGVWVLTTPEKTVMWKDNPDSKVWINLNAIDQLSIVPPKKPDSP